uniref:Uncharacterized protein n=1 Tax=Sphingobacterium sp. (strain 21) TaxID=743722 RepID=F4CBH9_SPHS2
MVNINLKWHHLNRNYRHYRTELAGTIRTVISIMKRSAIIGSIKLIYLRVNKKKKI